MIISIFWRVIIILFILMDCWFFIGWGFRWICLIWVIFCGVLVLRMIMCLEFRCFFFGICISYWEFVSCLMIWIGCLILIIWVNVVLFWEWNLNIRVIFCLGFKVFIVVVLMFGGLMIMGLIIWGLIGGCLFWNWICEGDCFINIGIGLELVIS